MTPAEKPPTVDLVEVAADMRRVWLRLTCGVRQDAHLEGAQRQQFWVLGALAESPRRMSDLATIAGVSQASLTGIVDRLEEHGLVERRRSDEDRRVVAVAITDAGRAEMSRKHEHLLARLEDLLAPLSPHDRREFARLLGELARAHGEPGCG